MRKCGAANWPTNPEPLSVRIYRNVGGKQMGIVHYVTAIMMPSTPRCDEDTTED